MINIIYRLLTDLAGPFISVYLSRRLAEGKEDVARFSERLGLTETARPDGRLVWCHAASVGEAMSVLCLIKKMRVDCPDLQILLTTGTVTSANMLAGLLPAGVIHQYVPVDRMPYVVRFLEHWSPDLVLWVESELWPNFLSAIKKRNIPAILLNGRLSEKSYSHWSYAKGSIKKLLQTFSLCLAQTEEDKGRFEKLGATNVQYIGNLKYAADPLPVNEADLEEVLSFIAKRPVWLMASTHEGEDAIALEVHNYCAATYPDLLTIIVPRHPTRGDEIVKQIHKSGHAFARRSISGMILPDTAIYLADTMGELGLFYRAAPIACIGGSFVWGGHNPIEPANLDCAVLFGPRMTNFASIAAEMVEAHAAIQVPDTDRLKHAIASLLNTETQLQAQDYADRASAFASEKKNMLKIIMQAITPWIKGETR